MDETQEIDNQKQAEVPAAADDKRSINDEMNDRLELLKLRTEASVISKIILQLKDGHSQILVQADALQEKIDGQQSFFEGPSGGDVSPAVQDNKQ